MIYERVFKEWFKSIKSSNLWGEILGAQILQILNGYLSVAVTIQNLKITFDISPRRGEDSVEWLISIHDHGHDLNTVDHSVSIPVVGVKDPSCNTLGSLTVCQAWVNEDGIVVGGRGGGVGSVVIVGLLEFGGSALVHRF